MAHSRCVRPRRDLGGGTHMHRVLILGGGFGGIATAVALRARLETENEVVLVERRPTFMMGLRKNWALLGESAIGEGERPLSLLADHGVRIFQDSVDTIHPQAKAAVSVGLGIEEDA